MRRLRHLAVCVLCTAGFLVPAQLLGAASAQAATFADLTLINGWTAGPFGTSRPQVEILSGIVHLKGAIAGGSAAGAFVLPAAYRPATNVFVPVDLANRAYSRSAEKVPIQKLVMARHHPIATLCPGHWAVQARTC